MRTDHRTLATDVQDLTSSSGHEYFMQGKEDQEQKIDRIKRELSQVPMLPGVYLWKDADGEVIYVGKAKQLRARMRQYVNFQDARAKIPLLVENIHSFEYIVVENEHESLVLEKNLINQYSPTFNVDYKDDKSYPFIAITEADLFPAIKHTREKHKAGSRYYGPFTDSRAARRLIDIARKVVPICSASCPEWRSLNRKLQAHEDMDWEDVAKLSPCFDAHVGLGPGACCGRISPDEYAQNVNRIKRFLAGERRDFTDELQGEMELAAQSLDFERASRIKSKIEVIESIEDKQHAVSSHNLSADIIGFFREETVAGVHILVVREGKIIYSNEFVLNKGMDVPDVDLVHNFLLKYYDSTESIPREVVLRFLPEDITGMESWLTEKLSSKHGAKVRLILPSRGEKEQLLQMAERNAKHALVRYKVRNNYDDKRTNEALLQLESALALEDPPKRIECFDISTFHGAYTVASMVVFTNGRPDKSQYRRFKIRANLQEANDFLSMQEVISRRYRAERMADGRFGSRPDLVILDGGKPQLTAAIKAFDDLGVGDIPIVGLAKRDEELFVPWEEDGSVILPSGSASLYLVKQVRDEAHRFAITFHRKLRGKGMVLSMLDDVPGIGPVRKKALLRHFKSMKNLKCASLDEIKESAVLPADVSETLYALIRDLEDGNGESAADADEEIEAFDARTDAANDAMRLGAKV